MVDAVWSESTPQPSLHLTPQPQTTITPQYLQISYGNAGSANSRRESLLSPSPNRRTKVQRGIAGECSATYFFLLPCFLQHTFSSTRFQFRQHTHFLSLSLFVATICSHWELVIVYENGEMANGVGVSSFLVRNRIYSHLKRTV